MRNSKKYWLNREMKMYVLMAMVNLGREIKCAACGNAEDLEIHHNKYEGATIYDLDLLCSKCHRGTFEKGRSQLKTIFRDGKRFCSSNHFEFEY